MSAERSKKELTGWRVVYLAWIVSLCSILGSLFFSEVMGLPPCALCWYQRIALYPLGLILAIGILHRDRRITRYSGPFAAIGCAAAIYHNLLYYHVISESLSPCTQGVSCTTPQIEWLGFITTPLLALGDFLIIGSCLCIARSNLRDEDEKR